MRLPQLEAMGWRSHKDRQYLPLQDDIASVAYWYQTLPTAPFPALPDRDTLEEERILYHGALFYTNVRE